MPPLLNPMCGHRKAYACMICGKCLDCCECRGSSEYGHVDSLDVQTRWRILRIQQLDQEARREER